MRVKVSMQIKTPINHYVLPGKEKKKGLGLDGQ